MMTSEEARKQIAVYLGYVRRRTSVVEPIREALPDLNLTALTSSGFTYSVSMDCEGYGEMRDYLDPTMGHQTSSKMVSQCCKAEVFKDGDRTVCEKCRLTAKLIAVPA